MSAPRRHFLGEMAKGIARTASDGRAAISAARDAVIKPALELISPAPTDTGVDAPALPPLLAPPARLATLEELVELAGKLGLERRASDVLACARTSWRLVRTTAEGASGVSQLGGRPARIDADSWPTRDGRPLPLLAQIDLTAVAPDALPSGFPSSETLLAFGDFESPAAARTAATLLVVPDDAPQADPDAGPAEPLPVTPIRACPELVLPRVWSAPVEQLELTPNQRDAWEQLRVQLAAGQGTEPSDRAPSEVEVQRLFGYPDERTGEMPLASELLTRGYELMDDPPAVHPAAAEAEAASGRWQLLLQLELTRTLPTNAFSRLYFWATAEDVAAGEVAGVQAFTR